MSFAIFMSEAASVFSAPCAFTTPSHEASASNLLGAVTNGSPVSRAISCGHLHRELRMRVQPGADRGAAERELAQVRQRGVDVRRARDRAATT